MTKHSHKHRPFLAPHVRLNRRQSALTAGISASVGILLLVSIFAASTFAQANLSAGILSGGASVVADSGASNGSAVLFKTGQTPTPSPTPAPTPTPSPTHTPTPQPTPTPTPQPVGASGNWTLTFDDEFNGTSLDTSRWIALEGYHTNNVTTHASNVSESGGNLVLTLGSSSSGAEVDSDPADGAGSNGYTLPVGSYVEARINFPGNGTSIYNWPAFWTSGPNWPAAGENDIAEGLGTLTVNYHSPSGAHNQGTVPGVWSNGFHTYGLYRGSNYADVYWDGVLVKSYTTDDNGQPQAILINVGGSGTYGTASQIKVDYVRGWKKS